MKYVLLASLFVSTFSHAANTLRCEYDNSLNELEFSLHDFEKKSFEKKFSTKDKNYHVKVSNILQPSEKDDFITIEKGPHKMTYSLKCSFFSNEVAKAYEPKQFR